VNGLAAPGDRPRALRAFAVSRQPRVALKQRVDDLRLGSSLNAGGRSSLRPVQTDAGLGERNTLLGERGGEVGAGLAVVVAVERTAQRVGQIGRDDLESVGLREVRLGRGQE
jgi:hypothetical protein